MKTHIITLIVTNVLCLSVLFAQDWNFKSGEGLGGNVYATQKKC